MMKTNVRLRKPGDNVRKKRDLGKRKNSVSETKLVDSERRRKKNVGALKLLAWMKNVRNEPQLRRCVLLQVVDLLVLVLEA